jgi:hypothetical protein
MVCEAIAVPRSFVVCAAAVATPVVPVFVVVPLPVLVEPEPLPLPVLEVVGGALTVLPPHAATKPATATAINGARNDDTVARVARREKKR